MSTATVPHTATQTKVVQARNVSKIFKRDAFEVRALDDVSIEIGSGEFLALMGPSGSGKTTLLNMIAAIDRPTAGELLVLGENIFRFSDSQSARWRNEHIGYVFQTFNLIPVLTAFENVELPLLLTKLNAQGTPRSRDDRAEPRWLRRARESSAQTTLRRTGTTRRDRARHRQRSHINTRGRADGRSRQPFGDGNSGDPKTAERRFSQDGGDGDARSARRIVRARNPASGEGNVAATSVASRVGTAALGCPVWCRDSRPRLSSVA